MLYSTTMVNNSLKFSRCYYKKGLRLQRPLFTPIGMGAKKGKSSTLLFGPQRGRHKQDRIKGIYFNIPDQNTPDHVYLDIQNNPLIIQSASEFTIIML